MRNRRFHSISSVFIAPFILITLVLLASCSQKPDNILHLGVTTTLEDSGLLSVIIDGFTQHIHQQDELGNIVIKPIVAGSGQLFTLIERGDIDIAISHEPKGEQALVDNGVILQRLPLFYNHFLLVGDPKDPAHIRSSLTIDETFKKILHSGHTFISRGDNSGTHQFEKSIWEDIWKDTEASPNQNQVVMTGTAMGATLAVAADRNTYTLVDLGTWLNFNNKQALTVLFPNKEAGYSDELKQQALRNQYSLLVLNPEKIHTRNKMLSKKFELESINKLLSLFNSTIKKTKLGI